MNDDLDALIYACARAAPDTDAEEILRLATAIPDWERVLETASAHSVLPLLVNRLGGALVPVPSFLAEAAGSAAARSLSLVALLLRARLLLAAQGIDTLAFKGPALSVSLYGDSALRQSIDIDLLVRRRQALAARQTLESAGYRFWLDLTPREEAAFLRYSNEYGLVDPNGDIVELSWALAPRHLSLDLDADRFFPDAATVELGGQAVKVLAPHDQLLALAVHGGKHLWERLGWITDIAQLMASTPDLDVDRALARARSVGAERLLLVAPALAEQVLGADVPPGLAAAIGRDPEVPELVERLVKRLLPLDKQHSDRALDPLTWRLRERARDRATIVARLAITPTVEDWQWARLPEPFSFAYPLVRPFRLAKKYLFS